MASLLLPVELWRIIFQFLRRRDLRSVFTTCRSFHDMVLKLLFSTVKFHFTAWDKENPLFLHNPEDALSLVNRTWEILDHIVEEPSFAHVVKRIVVHAFSPSTQNVFELRVLAKALRALPHLRGFQWFGHSPTCSEYVLASLGTSCPQLQELRIPNVPFDSALAAERFRNLEFFEPLYLTNRDGRDFNLDGTTSVISANTATLRHLRLYGHHIGQLPIRVFSDITSLDILIPNSDMEFSGMSLLVHHAASLESLSMKGFVSQDVFDVMEGHPSAFPGLKSFQISVAMPVHYRAQWKIISEFLQGRHSLRRLAVELNGMWVDFCDMIPALATLSSLEVLALSYGSPMLEDSVLEVVPPSSYFAIDLPSSLRALRLVYHWESHWLDGQSFATLLPMLEKMPFLSFLHIRSAGDTIPLDPDDIATDLKHLETLVLDWRMWDIYRDAEKVELSLWSNRRMNFHVADDFASADEEWLMRDTFTFPYF